MCKPILKPLYIKELQNNLHTAEMVTRESEVREGRNKGWKSESKAERAGVRLLKERE